MRKTDDETVSAPLEKFMGNVSNVITKLTPQFLVLDDPNFIKKFKTHCVSKGYTDIIINENYPLIVFGDMELIQLYLAGRIVYEDNKLYSKVIGTTIKGTPTGQQQANLAIQGKARDILHERETKLFDDDYIKNIAVPTFLNIVSNNASFSLPSDAFDISVNPSNGDIRNAVKSLDIPIFKIGYAESNILDADVNIKDYFNAAITKIRFPKGQSDLVFTGISPEKLELLNMVSKDGLGKLSKVLDNKSQNLPALKSELGKILLRDEKLNYLNKSPREKAKTTSEVVRFIITENQKGGPAFTQLQDILRKKDPYLSYYQLLGDLVQNTYQGVIKTLPLFKLSRSPELLPPALLLIRDSSFVPYETQTNGIIDSIRGFYNIMGYKHTISKSEVCSELFIIRHINLGGIP